MTASLVAARRSGWSIAEAGTVRARGRGLLGRRGLGDRAGLWLPVRSVHTVGMRFALDLVWLDAGGRPVRLDEGVRAGRVRTCLRARGGVVEVAAGRGAALAGALTDRGWSAAQAGRSPRSSSSTSSSRRRVAR